MKILLKSGLKTFGRQEGGGANPDFIPGIRKVRTATALSTSHVNYKPFGDEKKFWGHFLAPRIDAANTSFKFVF